MLQKDQIKALRDAQAILSRTLFTSNPLFRNFLYGELAGKFFEMSPLDIAIAFFDAHPEFEDDYQPIIVTLTEVDGQFYYGNYPTDQLRMVLEHEFVLNVFHKYGNDGVPTLYWNLLDKNNIGTTGRLIYNARDHRLHPLGCCLDQIQGYKKFLEFVIQHAYAYFEIYPELINQFRYFQQVN